MKKPRPFHRLFGLSWVDLLKDSPVQVDTEVDLSIKQQLLDLVLIRHGERVDPGLLPDGFDRLAPHTLMTFKSHQEALTEFALQELVGHYVNYRKRASRSLDDLLPRTDFRLFAVCVAYPQMLAAEVPLTRVQDGVYDTTALGLMIRVVGVHRLSMTERNAVLHMFSGQADELQYALDHYRPRSLDTSTLWLSILHKLAEDPAMSQKLKEFVRETLDGILQGMTLDERLSRVRPRTWL